MKHVFEHKASLTDKAFTLLKAPARPMRIQQDVTKQTTVLPAQTAFCAVSGRQTALAVDTGFFGVISCNRRLSAGHDLSTHSDGCIKRIVNNGREPYNQEVDDHANQKTQIPTGLHS
ncbi:hypothetical protein [Dickeya sp. NCPPB 3274]|uniref:hypothetical protein n=1 Tax=Dickeya sp. NCPPB 3274 TaxID=568766 RepID=UPI00187C391C|nr:hypothetical protein [Dickeya sp. NCPPB 3274]